MTCILTIIFGLLSMVNTTEKQLLSHKFQVCCKMLIEAMTYIPGNDRFQVVHIRVQITISSTSINNAGTCRIHIPCEKIFVEKIVLSCLLSVPSVIGHNKYFVHSGIRPGCFARFQRFLTVRKLSLLRCLIEPC